MHYTVEPGLYALGKPDERSPVLVTANYKMSFDKLREALPGRDMWILVLDTKGINVWCAAGKGTFGTMELVERIKSCNLSQIVSHRELILPQLSGPGVAAHHVKKLSGFKVIYGSHPGDRFSNFLDNGLKATPR
jgi:acetyl-CoA decarbonylase/synthase complex subunit gamma